MDLGGAQTVGAGAEDVVEELLPYPAMLMVLLAPIRLALWSEAAPEAGPEVDLEAKLEVSMALQPQTLRNPN